MGHRRRCQRETTAHVKELWSVWRSATDPRRRLTYDRVIGLFHAMDLYPSKSQIQEMVHSSRDCSTRTADEMTFASFCLFVNNLKKKVPPPPVISCQQERPPARLCKSAPPIGCGKYEVFLGGSCNPTTWRRDEAIPRLKELGITYYNPQVASWHPGLIALEEEAKQSATVLFFVIDNQTRGVSSMLEASYLAASGRKLVLVVSRHASSATICGEKITNTEYCDLNRTQNYLQDLVERQGLPVFETISSALDCTDKVLKKDIRVQDLRLDDNAVPVRNAHITLADKLHKLREVFANQDSEGRGSLSPAEVCTALRVCTGRTIYPNDCLALMAQIREVTEQTAGGSPDGRLSFEDFCLLVTELQGSGRRGGRGGRQSPSVLSRTAEMMHQLLTPLTRVAEWVLPQRLARQLSNGSAPTSDVRDVYLGGTLTNTSWRENIAIPILKKSALTFEHPATLLATERLTPTEAARLERCRTLLFVITDTSRAPAHMTMAAHYIGRGASVVLCIQMLPDNCVIQGEKLSPTAIKDYNRGRSYLSDLASRKGVPVFETVAEAVQKAAQLSRRAR
ncbi:uncharacterized protein LOC122373284 isoform X2 [Amphibalanus amphitrite]|uniref:uncharacterized protein LOC122373284 isoform X2 n=2 Tax=Amphibalanus amphitrite TaxID=1232801 RepID=UPI001C91063B|nr:uncharacterized protein LOC122373284 isoform X2 [Amphibalanus amphitrite]